MRLLPVLALFACTGTPPAGPPVKVEFVQTPTAWQLSPGSEGHTRIVLQAGSHTLDLGEVEGTCEPTADLPFKDVQGQRALAALQCTDPDKGSYNAVVVEVRGDDPEWPAPVAVALVATRVTEGDKVMLMSLGATELPLGVIPLAPELPQDPTP